MPGGRPKIIESPEAFENNANIYFKENEGKKISWTGLCLAVGASSRETLQRYKRGEHGKEFVDPIKRALLIVENYYEENDGGAKDMFVLKNFNWSDNRNIGIANKDDKPFKTKSTLETGPGLSATLEALENAVSTRKDNLDEGDNKT